MPTPRTCPVCGTALAADAAPARVYCTTRCQARAKYARNPERLRTKNRDRYREKAGIPLDAPLARNGRHRNDGTR